jgi:hypothetical protein
MVTLTDDDNAADMGYKSRLSAPTPDEPNVAGENGDGHKH